MADIDDDDEDFSTLDRGDSFIPDDEDDEEIEEDENEDEEDDEEVEEDDEDEEEEDTPPVKGNKVPISRLNEVIKQREERDQRINWLEKQLELVLAKGVTPATKETNNAEPDYPFEEKETEYANLLIEGDVAKAIKLKTEIEQERKKEIKKLLSEVNKETKEKVEGIPATLKFDALVETYEEKYPFLDSEASEYNEEAIDTVNTLLAGYVQKGMTKSEALTKAVNKVAPFYAKEKNPKESGKTRKEVAAKKAAKASNAQPPKTKSSASANVDTSKIDIKRLSEKDFSKLTLKEKKLLRGD